MEARITSRYWSGIHNVFVGHFLSFGILVSPSKKSDITFEKSEKKNKEQG